MLEVGCPCHSYFLGLGLQLILGKFVRLTPTFGLFLQLLVEWDLPLIPIWSPARKWSGTFLLVLIFYLGTQLLVERDLPLSPIFDLGLQLLVDWDLPLSHIFDLGTQLLVERDFTLSSIFGLGL